MIKSQDMRLSSSPFFILLLVVGFFFWGSVSLLDKNLRGVLKDLSKRVELIVFLKPDLTPRQAQEIQRHVMALPNIQEVHLRSKEEALMEFLKDGQLAPEVHLAGTENPLPSSLEVRLKERSPQSVASAEKRLKVIKGIEEIISLSGEVKSLLAMENHLKRLVRTLKGVLLISFLGLAVAASIALQPLGFLSGLLDGFLGGILACAGLFSVSRLILTDLWPGFTSLEGGDALRILFQAVIAGVMIRLLGFFSARFSES